MMRRQRTIARTSTVTGVGLFHGADVTLRFRPAPENHGIAFQRIDLDETVLIPALIDYALPLPRRTAISHNGVTVETIEHAMAALAGLQIDNCIVQLDAPEPPVGDGSAQHFADALMESGIVEQSALRSQLVVRNKAYIFSLDRREELTAIPTKTRGYKLTYELDYRHPDLPVQTAVLDVTPQSFLDALAFARTFVLEEEVAILQAQGLGLRMTPRNLLVFGADGPIDNRLHTPDECARHKLLDCIGDFALLGCDLRGEIIARRSGHRHNRELVRDLLIAHPHANEVIRQQNRCLEFGAESTHRFRRVS
ncbi:MAG: UDP-3-O-acyl-N-acetylglucosamine deacetylase [Planctomycetaceae bacterium]|nr:UDP-3-O-acyl-N-acetylglucosamine deacetylase [Planctomycetaceae bacterium]